MRQLELIFPEETEIWKDIEGYEGLYMVSNWGRVRSLPRKTPAGMRGGRVLKPAKDGGGYLQVGLCIDNRRKAYKVHRLVATAFIPNPNNLPLVNHKDEIKCNNHVENLEWCTIEYNDNYGTRNERIGKTNSKTVYQYTLDGEFVREWVSTSEIERQTGWKFSNIASCCRGIYKHSHNYKWSYVKL